MTTNRIGLALLFGLFLGLASAFAQSGPEILARMDRNRDFKTMIASARMEIHVDNQVRTKTMEIQGRSEGSKSLVRFTNPEDAGTKYLKLGDDLWIYFPSENDVVKISGHLLKDGMMGSDVSYEDALDTDLLSERYNVAITGTDTIAGNACWVLTLEAKTKDAPYFKRTLWVDQKTYVAWKEDMFAKSERLLKQSRVLEVREVSGRHVSVRSEVENKLRKNSKTVFIMEKIAFDEPVSESLFTMRNLRR